MTETTVKKVQSSQSPIGSMGQAYLVAGKTLSMRLWDAAESLPDEKTFRERDYETLGYVLEGRAELETDDQKIDLGPGDSWIVPAHVRHRYRVRDGFRAVEATSPPAEFHDRDKPASPA